MTNLYRILADVTVFVHFAYAAFIVVALVAILLGAALGWSWVRNFWFRTIHLVMIGVVAAEAVLGVACPLTVWEKHFRDAAGQATHGGSFLGNMAHDVLFFEFPEWVFSTTYVLFFLAVAATFVVARPRWPTKRVTPPGP